MVAGEVKVLATQTTKATEDISAQIARIQGSTEHAVNAIGGIRHRIEEMSGVSTSIAVAVEEQGAATREIARNISQAAAGTGQVTENVAVLAGAAEEAGSAAVQVFCAASELSRQSEQLKREVGSFLDTIRAA